jgi:hypothetical protein
MSLHQLEAFFELVQRYSRQNELVQNQLVQ